MEKADRSPVTVADLGSQVLISLALGEAFPADPVMGEEDASQIRGSATGEIRGSATGEIRGSATGEIRAALQVHLAPLLPDLDEATAEAALERCADAGGPTGRWWALDPV
ncbi:MAG: hypothetical protein LH650_11065, partial [Chloroflexi bacterium]|nr:hypothetical protein [Chloroflexota bacterium]